MSRQPTLNIVTEGSLSSPECLEVQVVRKWASYILAAKGISGESRVAQITADVTVAGVVIVVFTRWNFEMYKNTMGQIKNTTNDYWGCFLVECVQETCNFLRARSLEATLPTSMWLGDNREVTFTTQNG